VFTRQHHVTYSALKINSIFNTFTPVWSVLSTLMIFLLLPLHIIKRHLQQTLNTLQTWVDTNGFKFSVSKTVCVHFYKLHTVNPDPVFLLNRTPIAVVELVKFLNLIFDKQLIVDLQA